jgi:hypothetical protein
MGFKQDDRPVKSAKEFAERMRQTSGRQTDSAREERKKGHPDAFAPRSATPSARRPTKG